MGFLMLWISQACKDNVGHRTNLSVFRLIVARQLSLRQKYWKMFTGCRSLKCYGSAYFLKTDFSKDFLPNRRLGSGLNTDIYYSISYNNLTLPDEMTMELRNDFAISWK